MPEGVPRIFVVRADCVPQLEADWVILQPDVFREDPTQGWHPVRGQSFLGYGEDPRMRFRPEDPETLCEVNVDDEGALRVQNFSDEPLRLVMRSGGDGGARTI